MNRQGRFGPFAAVAGPGPVPRDGPKRQLPISHGLLLRRRRRLFSLGRPQILAYQGQKEKIFFQIFFDNKEYLFLSLLI